ncbi:MAG: 3-keto-5-aminohexanoate cleavage protein, partial [Rhodospirillaceae bacterium]
MNGVRRPNRFASLAGTTAAQRQRLSRGGTHAMARPVIIACAVTGSADSTGMNPAVPVTPEEIANE